mgnify:CR=1 FL=1
MSEINKNSGEHLNDLVDAYAKRQKSSFRRTVSLSLLLIIFVSFFFFLFIEKSSTHTNEIREKSEELIELKKLNQESSELLSDLDSSLELIRLTDSHLSNETAQKFDTIRQKIEGIKGVKPIYFASGFTTLRYYRRPADDPNLEIIIKSLGFDPNIKQSTDDTTNNQPVNFVIYGDSVSTREVRKLMLALYDNGISFKQLRRMRQDSNYVWKNKAIEIGYNGRLNDSEYLSKEEILELID